MTKQSKGPKPEPTETVGPKPGDGAEANELAEQAKHKRITEAESVKPAADPTEV